MNIVKESVVDGEGIRTVVFTAGCPHRCEGCHNPDSWSAANGKWDADIIQKLIDSPHDITFSGGEPLYQYVNLFRVVKYIKEHTHKTIWLYTGYNFDAVQHLEIFDYIDVVVDGQYEQDKRDISLPFRGSSNQRIIAVKKSLVAKRVIPYSTTAM